MFSFCTPINMAEIKVQTVSFNLSVSASILGEHFMTRSSFYTLYGVVFYILHTILQCLYSTMSRVDCSMCL